MVIVNVWDCWLNSGWVSQLYCCVVCLIMVIVVRILFSVGVVMVMKLEKCMLVCLEINVCFWLSMFVYFCSSVRLAIWLICIF